MTDPHSAPALHTLVEDASPDTVVVLCHGRGATAASMTPLARALARPRVAVLAPQAGLVGGAPQWYPNSFLAPLDANEPGLSSGLASVGRAVEAARALGVADEQIVLGGFSQGACLAVEYAARQARHWGGVLAFSGALIGTAEDPDARASDTTGLGRWADKRFDYPDPLTGTSVFFGCAEHDAHIPRARVERSEEVLQALGADVTTHLYPGDVHAVVDDEVQYARQLLDYLAC